MDSLRLAVLSFALTACGGSVTSNGEEPRDATAGDDAGDADVDAADASAPCTLGAGAVVTDAAPSAYVELDRFPDPELSTGGIEEFFGTFYASPTAFHDYTCCQTIGPCMACAAPCDVDGGAPRTLNAGVLELIGPGFAPLSVAFDSDAGSYSSATSDPTPGTVGPAFNAGDTLCVAGSGDQASSFPSLPIVAPQPLPLTSPTIPVPDAGDFSITIATTQDLPLAWTPTASDETASFYFDWFYPQLICSFAGSAGTGTIPQAALATMRGRLGAPTTFQASVIRSRTYGVGPYAIRVSAASIITGYATFQ
jgi:hypothetical protein